LRNLLFSTSLVGQLVRVQPQGYYSSLTSFKIEAIEAMNRAQAKRPTNNHIFKVLQTIALIHLITCHNILRMSHTRRARFVLRHTGRVQGATHYRELVVADEAVCIDKCVADDPCKSINAHTVNSSAVICQLVDKDITDNSDYAERPEWRHFDTGRSTLTRIRTKNGWFCLAPPQACDFEWDYIHVYHITSATGTLCAL